MYISAPKTIQKCATLVEHDKRPRIVVVLHSSTMRTSTIHYLAPTTARNHLLHCHFKPHNPEPFFLNMNILYPNPFSAAAAVWAEWFAPKRASVCVPHGKKEEGDMGARDTWPLMVSQVQSSSVLKPGNDSHLQANSSPQFLQMPQAFEVVYATSISKQQREQHCLFGNEMLTKACKTGANAFDEVFLR
ncbi:hypothetical protein LguiA_033860 [Lonicera macranthoides]